MRVMGDELEGLLGLVEEARCVTLQPEWRARLLELEVAARRLREHVGEPGRGSVEGEPNGTLLVLREGEYWTLQLGKELCRLRDSRGLQMLARLVAEPGREIHSLELAGGHDDGGDAGEALDAQAVSCYRARVRELRGELEEAESFADQGRVWRARAELAALEEELARGLGLGGRRRRVGQANERARVNVRRRLADAIRRSHAAAPPVGAHLAASVITGMYCAYVPARRGLERSA